MNTVLDARKLMLARIDGTARRVSEELGRVPLSMIGYLTGALHSLRQAIELGYADDRVRTKRLTYALILSRAVVKNDPKYRNWLAGVAFNNTIHRMGALLERLIDKHTNLKGVLTPTLVSNQELSNQFILLKHDWNDAKHKHYGLHGTNKRPILAWKDEKRHWTSGTRGKRRTLINDALRVVEMLVDIILARGDKTEAARKALGRT